MKRYQQDSYGDIREREDGKYCLAEEEADAEIAALRDDLSYRSTILQAIIDKNQKEIAVLKSEGKQVVSGLEVYKGVIRQERENYKLEITELKKRVQELESVRCDTCPVHPSIVGFTEIEDKNIALKEQVRKLERRVAYFSNWWKPFGGQKEGL
jgi:polyhydroxyalkanoate synthesis regulator phasin